MFIFQSVSSFSEMDLELLTEVVRFSGNGESQLKRRHDDSPSNLIELKLEGFSSFLCKIAPTSMNVVKVL